MEFNFVLLVLAASAGMAIKLSVGWDPWNLVGFIALTLSIILLLLPLLGLAFENDPQVVQETTNAVIERIVVDIPSILVGAVAGVFARAILGFATSLSRAGRSNSLRRLLL